MLPDLCGTLLRSRLNPFLITADVEKAFHQIRLQEDQRDATRFLWLENPNKPPTKENIRILRFTRIPFGINASPFLLNISIKYGLERDSSNRLREEILANTYVDNVLISAKSTYECIMKQRECKDTFRSMGMNLREFMSNNGEVMRIIPVKDRMTQKSTTVKLLGLRWNPQNDTTTTVVRVGSEEVRTKRTALKAFASTFDPLGFLPPLFVKIRILVQDLWKTGNSWDDPLDEITLNRWSDLVQEIDHFVGNVPRFVGHATEPNYNLVVSSDATTKVYATVAYLVCSPLSGKPTSHIIMSKSKLASPDPTTIPRMELLACYLAAKMTRFLRSELKIHLYSINFLSDSQIALYWIHSQKPLKSFVENRVKYIRNALDSFTSTKTASRFFYVNTDANLADYATRGLTANELSTSSWWSGPSFICSPPSD
ncbi:hypothetical protein Aduo_008613 [Ancylostoma duodenale]